MALITARQILDRAATTLYDQTNINWPLEELIEHLSDAQRASVLYLPEINPVAEVVQLIAGTRQTIPPAGHVLIDVVRNMGVGGNAPGRAIFEIDRTTLDHDTPDWHTIPVGNAVVEVKNFSYDTRDRRGFYIFPSQSAAPTQLEIIYSSSPPELTDLDGVIGLDDVYQPALLSYTLHRALAKNLPLDQQAAAKAASTMYFEQFVLTLTGQKMDEQRLHPRQETDQLAR